MIDRRARERRLFDLLEPSVEREGYELVAVELVSSGGGRPSLRVSIDKPGGVSVRDCSRVSRALSALLDVEDPIEGAFNLEVSSPGIERPLQRRSDFVRFAGFRAKIQLEAGEPRRRYTGVLGGIEQGSVVIESNGERSLLPIERIERARLVLDLDEYERLAEEPPPRPEGDWS